MTVETQVNQPQIKQSHRPLPPTARSVVVVIDAWCEIDPAVAAQLNIVVLPREVKVDGQDQALDGQRTLHHSCWPQLPRMIAPKPLTLSAVARVYEQVLVHEFSVLALTLPERFDPTVAEALKARSILLAGQRSRKNPPPRIAVYELTTAGANFALLVQIAARAAAEGMTLRQVMVLLDRVQAEANSYYLTGTQGPPQAFCQTGRWSLRALPGQEQVWQIDGQHGRFVRRACRRGLTQKLFQKEGMLAGKEPAGVYSSDARLFARLNSGRTAAQQSPLVAHPGGLSLTPLFPKGCVELSWLPDKANIERICDAIRRIDTSSTSTGRGVRQRGAI
jgi:hypothetical protein